MSPTFRVQPGIVNASLAGLRVLDSLGVSARVAIGHSLGELTALHWAGAYDAGTLVELTRTRGSLMTEHSGLGGMMSVNASGERAAELIAGLPLTIAACNTPFQAVVYGGEEALSKLNPHLTTANVKAARVPVSHPFHSPLMQPAAAAFDPARSRFAFRPLAAALYSTVTGRMLDPTSDLRSLLVRQLVDPVLFQTAFLDAK